MFRKTQLSGKETYQAEALAEFQKISRIHSHALEVRGIAERIEESAAGNLAEAKRKVARIPKET